MPKGTIAIIGSETLVGREIRELLSERGLDSDVELLSEGDQILSAEEDEPAVLIELSADALEDAGTVVLAGSAESSRKALQLAPAAATIIDVSGALEDEPEARITGEPSGKRIFRVVPHPAAVVLARILRPVHAFQPIEHSVVHVFEPASERGQAGINELQQQTTSLLSFRPLDKAVFDAQVSFNMLPRYGSEAPQALEAVEQRIEHHLASLLLQGVVPMPSLRVVQAPVFHGHSFSFWINFEQVVEVEALAAALAEAGVDLRSADVEPPTNVGSAGQNDAAVGVLEADRNHPHTVWMWAASDNLRIAAEIAVALVTEVHS